MASDIEKQIDVVDGTITQDQADAPDYAPIYRVYENTRIPVSKSVGKLWKHRWEESKKLNEQTGAKDRWDEAVRYYQHDQGGREGKRARLSEVGSGSANEMKYGSENIVFANTSALVPAIYAKNPDVEITPDDEEQEQSAKLYEKLIDGLFKRKHAPGLNLKSKMRRLVVTSTLTNIAYLELSYVQKENSSEEVVKEIEALSKDLEKATKQEDVKEIEGKLQALEEKVSLLSPSGARVRFRMPDMVHIDPNCEDISFLSDADYVIVGDLIRTDFMRAQYGQKDDNGEWMSVYKPTHVLSGEKTSQGHDDEINNFTLLTEGSEHEKYGYKTKDEFNQNCRTLVWYVWDRTTRRVLMFNDADWSWPVWVWDDPYKLSRFYPIFPLTFYTDPTDRFGRSEVMYYLDQQDEINEINNERARMRHWVMSKIFVNINNVKDASKVERFLNGDTKSLVFGLDIPEGKKISDILGSFPAPSTAFEGLFDARPVIESINRLSSVTPVLQNVQYKTNTTNKAIESYESSTQMRLDEKIDAIEELLADLGRSLLEMCVQFMSEEQVAQIVGKSFLEQHGGWQAAQEVQTFNEQFSFSIVGGSTLKPTARVKKDQAMQLGQILGQFANASPMLVIVMLKMLQRAFSDDVVITDSEWNTIVQATQMQMQRGGPGQGEGGEGGQPQQPQQPTQGEQTGDIGQLMAQVEQVIDRLPPEAKQFLGAGIAKGVPLKQLVQQLTQAAQRQQQQRPQ